MKFWHDKLCTCSCNLHSCVVYWERGVLMTLNVADEISNNFLLCWCKLVFNDVKVCLVCPTIFQIVCHISTQSWSVQLLWYWWHQLKYWLSSKRFPNCSHFSTIILKPHLQYTHQKVNLKLSYNRRSITKVWGVQTSSYCVL